MENNFETPYDEEDEFIECTVCEKSIRGETLYKIHLTTPGHLKKEDAVVASGLAVRQQHVPMFEDIVQYLDYMKLDEPIIGLSYLEELPCNDPQAGPRYSCKLCNQNANLSEMVRHVIGRKHRQKYVELKRPDLVTWTKQSIITHGGKIIRAKAEIIERQDGRGCPTTAAQPTADEHESGFAAAFDLQSELRCEEESSVPDSSSCPWGSSGRLRRPVLHCSKTKRHLDDDTNKMAKRGIEGRLNISRVPPRQKQNRGRNISQSLTQRDVPPLLPELKDYQDEYSGPARYPPGHPNTHRFHPEDPYMLNRDRPMYQQEDTLSHDGMEEELRRADYRERDMSRREYMDPDYRLEYEEEYVEDPQRRNILRPGGVPMYDSSEEMPRGQAHHVDNYSGESPPYRRPYPERDPLKEFYSEEVRHGRVRSAEDQPSQPVFPAGDVKRWSLDREPSRFDSMNRAGRQGSSEPDANRRSFPTLMESDRSRDHLFGMTRDYGHGMRQLHQEEAVANPGSSRTGPPISQRRVEATMAMTDIPEPFRRFLKGATNNEDHGKRKRKSRFSDATAEEVETTKEMFSDDYGPPNPKFGGRPRPVSVPLRPEIHRPQNPDLYIESQSPHHTESYQRGSESTGVFDMLKNIDVENAEEADFLKNKLCNLLKEFKTKKSEKAVQNSQGRAATSRDYNSLNPDLELSPIHQYDTTFREDLDLREPEELYFKEDHRGRGWHEHVSDERLQEYHHPVRGESRQSNRNRYEDVFGRQRMSQMPHATHPDEPAYYSERLREPMRPRDYPPAAEEFLDSRSSAPPLHMERGPRMDRGSRYSNSLDKITTTLLELVARK